jgi:hypothetical protein
MNGSPGQGGRGQTASCYCVRGSETEEVVKPALNLVLRSCPPKRPTPAKRRSASETAPGVRPVLGKAMGGQHKPEGPSHVPHTQRTCGDGAARRLSSCRGLLGLSCVKWRRPGGLAAANKIIVLCCSSSRRDGDMLVVQAV